MNIPEQYSQHILWLLFIISILSFLFLSHTLPSARATGSQKLNNYPPGAEHSTY